MVEHFPGPGERHVGRDGRNPPSGGRQDAGSGVGLARYPVTGTLRAPRGYGQQQRQRRAAGVAGGGAPPPPPRGGPPPHPPPPPRPPPPARPPAAAHAGGPR